MYTPAVRHPNLLHAPAARNPNLPPACPACATYRTRIVGQSGEPPLVHYRCEACEDVFSRPLRDLFPPDPDIVP